MRNHSAVLTVLLLSAAWGCGGETETPPAWVSGYVDATEVRLSTKIGGTLDWFPIEEGDRLRQRQEVARIDTVDLRLSLQGASAERDLARAELDLRLAGFRKEEIAEAEAQVAQWEADLQYAQKELNRMQGLLESGSGTAQAVDDAIARRDAANARLEAALERLRKLKAGTRVEEIEAARARLAAAEARIEQIRQQIADATVVSPLDGLVTEKIAEPGEILAPGALLAIVTDLRHAWLAAYVTEPDLGRIRIGQEARVTTDGGEERSGRLVFIASEAEFTPKNVQTRDERVKLVYKIKIALDNEDGLFKLGMPAEAVFLPPEAPL